jgi:hypothetical protein
MIFVHARNSAEFLSILMLHSFRLVRLAKVKKQSIISLMDICLLTQEKRIFSAVFFERVPLCVLESFINVTTSQ